MTRIIFLFALFAVFAFGGDWLTYGHDPQRSGWAVDETTLTPQNVGTLRLQWKTKLKNDFYRLSALTAPVVADGKVYVAGITGRLFALDAATGAEVWNHEFKTVILPGKGGYQGTFLCPNGITATPVIDKTRGMIFIIAPDGALYGVDLNSGKVVYGPVTFVAPLSKNWSLNLVNDVIYTVLAQGCGNGLSGFYAIDIRDRHHPEVRQMLLSNTNTAGIWGRGGAIVGTNGRAYGGTADGKFDPAAGDYSNSVVGITLRDLKLADYFLPPNWEYLNHKDLDLGAASPVFFHWRDRDLVAHGAKEGVVNLMDAESLGGRDHQTPLYTTPRLVNDRQVCCEGLGIWGGLSTARSTDGQTWLFVPVGGPVSESAPKFAITNGENPHGSFMAFHVAADANTHDPVLEPVWNSGDFDLPDPAVIANGVLFAVSTGENAVQKGGEDKRLLNTHPAVLKALDMKTGKELFNSGDAMESWVHFSGLAISDGRVFAVDHDSNVYCFGLPAAH